MKICITPKITQSLWLYGVIGWIIGTYYFFQTPHDLSLLIFKENQGAAFYYREFSATIFQPQWIYIAESILWPLIAKLLNASSSLIAYQALNVFATLLVMPMICIALKRRIGSTLGVFLAIIIWSVSFIYLKYYDLGFPDPVTIILLALVVAQTRKESIFIFAVLAALSHFSCASLALLGFLVLSVADKYTNNREKGFAEELYVIYGLVCGKLFLLLWGYIFHYRLNSRIDIVFEKGIGFFIDRYFANPIEFLNTPGLLFLVMNLIICIYFMLEGKLLLCLAQLTILALAYFSLFMTVDGLRVFAVVSAPGYLYLIILFMNDLFKKQYRSPILI
jgi:hypothetical protein